MAGLISDRLKNLGFMKRRAERDKQQPKQPSQLSAPNSTKTTKTQSSTKLTPLVVLDNQADDDDDDDDDKREIHSSSKGEGRRIRSGRRSFGNFNPKLEAIAEQFEPVDESPVRVNSTTDDWFITDATREDQEDKLRRAEKRRKVSKLVEGRKRKGIQKPDHQNRKKKKRRKDKVKEDKLRAVARQQQSEFLEPTL